MSFSFGTNRALWLSRGVVGGCIKPYPPPNEATVHMYAPEYTFSVRAFWFWEADCKTESRIRANRERLDVWSNLAPPRRRAGRKLRVLLGCSQEWHVAAPWHHPQRQAMCAFIAECKHARIRVQQNGEWHSKAGCSDFLERNVWNIYEFLGHTLYTTQPARLAPCFGTVRSWAGW